jgi:hypothetical protein
MEELTAKQINEEVETYHKILKKLIGRIKPQGESNGDRQKFANLQVMTELTNRLILDIDEVAHDNHNRQEASMKKAGQFALKWLEVQRIDH